ncbi:hypothetical protein [Sphingomonas sp. 1185]|uniref:hypothetical protein n=1 Tax=Sphingomonas sp. 1185 TaxID=3156411 RepID=UPI00339105BD
MTRHVLSAASEIAVVPVMLVDAARCWRDARDSGQPVQPCLAQRLDRRGCAMLAPVLDSLYVFFEAALGRPMAIGAASALSDDEHLLVSLVDGSAPRTCLRCPKGARTALDCALCSTRIMLTLTLGQPATRTMQ